MEDMRYVGILRSRGSNFRIKGKIDIIDSSTKDHAKMQQRVKSWFASSLKSRFQYLGPVPRFPVINEKLSNDSELDPSAGPVDTFCLLVFYPEEVDYLNLKRNERLLFALRCDSDESITWWSEKVNP
ncbi:hypothetical protein HPP92_015098 [Vanilla planifolia]|uniref:Pyridoxal 5'-phosphate synthase n=1 Tax=Vanilla planifolia TaxID=51239 RepID=A0A835QH83_VANPL|nr:hypothetical protein HPP92_015098 [Vanilla planifolia]